MTTTPPPVAEARGNARGEGPTWAPYAMLVLATVFWAGNFVVARALRDVLPPVSLNVWRWLVALAILLPWAGPELLRHRALVLRHAALVLALGATGVAAFHTFVYLALASTTVTSAVLIASTVPVVIPVLSWLLYRDRITRRQALGIALSFVGALTVVMRGDPGALASLRLDAGALWMVAAVPAWSLYTVLLKVVPKAFPPRTLLLSTTIAGLLLLLPLYAWRVAAGEVLPVRLDTAAAVLYVGAFASVLAFLFWNRGVATIGPNRAGLFIHLMPLFGALLAFLFLSETLAPYHLVGAVLVVSGVMVARRSPTDVNARRASA
ncbi:MAG: DMT family transporter [Trueperaceae bacterium]|nr:DMT family transporter [Trueperaceae bacterium]